ncbi:hypothetical protein GALL_235960 [mine drainage metagenome]|uniref:Lipoprotein n=1 Tax=mine drainage metagenome TaxID=410659 RepID=A0A1J5REC1_9ZZZZ
MRILLISVLLILSACSEKEHSAIEPKETKSIVSNTQTNVATSAVIVVSASDVGVASNVTSALAVAEGMPVPGKLYQSKKEKYNIGVASLGLSFTELLSHFNYDATEENSGYLMVFRNGEPIFSLNDKNDLQDKVARNIVITSPNISTDGDVHVGLPVNELLRKFPNLSIEMDLEDHEEYFAPPELEKGTRKFPDARILLYVTSRDGKYLSFDSQGTYPTKKFSSDGVISSIRVFKTGN